MTNLITILIPALMAVESGGDIDAVGDDGKAVGCLQIHECVIRDVNRIYKTRYVSEDRLSYERSVEICEHYLQYYGYALEENHHRGVGLEDLARIWNGGPRGYQKASTLGYWKKVESELERLKESE